MNGCSKITCNLPCCYNPCKRCFPLASWNGEGVQQQPWGTVCCSQRQSLDSSHSAEYCSHSHRFLQNSGLTCFCLKIISYLKKPTIYRPGFTWPVTAIQQQKKIPSSMKYRVKNGREELCSVTWICCFTALCLNKTVISTALSWQLIAGTAARPSWQESTSPRSAAAEQCHFSVVLALISKESTVILWNIWLMYLEGLLPPQTLGKERGMQGSEKRRQEKDHKGPGAWSSCLL